MPEFLLLLSPNEQQDARLGLAFSKKFIAKASSRNRIKRIFRESFRQQQLPAVDIVALSRKGLGQTDNDELFARLVKAWQKVNSFYAG